MIINNNNERRIAIFNYNMVPDGKNKAFNKIKIQLRKILIIIIIKMKINR